MHKSVALVSLLSLSCVTPATAQEPSQAEMMAMMAAMQKLATPGKEHKFLQQMVGEWTFTAKMRMGPGTPYQTTKGSSSYSSLLGGRFVQQHMTMTIDMGMGPMPMEGFQILGYDNMKKHYTSQWFDNYTTWAQPGTGKMNKQGQLELRGLMVDAMSPKGRMSRQVYGFDKKGNMTFDMFDTAPDGKEYHLMTITSTRKKASSKPARPVGGRPKVIR